MPTQIEEITDSGMSTQESLSLLYQFEFSHPSLPFSGSLMGLLCPIILILLCTVYRLRYQFTMGNTITAQCIRHDLSGLSTMAAQ